MNSYLRFAGLLLIALSLAACNPVAGTAATDTPAVPLLDSSTPTTTEPPTPLPVQAKDVLITLGTPELVFDYSEDTCRRANGLDLPDTPARAVRAPDGGLVLISSNSPANFLMYGTDFEHLEHSCTPSLLAANNSYAFTFDNQEWLLSVYSDGETIHALVHNEFHDPLAENCLPGVSTTNNLCWYNSITYAYSTDGGRTFIQPPAPEHLVAALPIPWDSTFGVTTDRSGRLQPPPPQGYMSPSNIVRGQDGYYYTLFRSMPDPLQPGLSGTCLMRTENLGDPKSWRAWDGTGFGFTMYSPYDAQDNPAPTGLPACTFVSHDAIRELNDSLTFNTYLNQYIVVGANVYYKNNQPVCGTFFSLSQDLIHWSEPQLMMTGELTYEPCIGTDNLPNGAIMYPSLIDHASTDSNFEYTGQTDYLYYILWNEGLDRDLWRVPITFTITGGN